MRVALITPELTPSYGWSRYSIELAHALTNWGIKIVLITSSASPGDAGLHHEGYYPILPSLTPAARWKTPKQLVQSIYLRKLMHNCDVIHVTAEPYLPVASIARLAQPLFLTAHGTYLPYNLGRPIIKHIFAWALKNTCVLPVSNYTASEISRKAPNTNLRLIPNAVDFTKFENPPVQLPNKTGPTILSVGVNKPRKGFHILIQSMANVVKTFPNAQCIIIGGDHDYEYVSQLRGQIQDNNLEQNVHILGRVTEEVLLGWYHQADIFVLPAIRINEKFEGFGLVYLEAMCAGLPVIGTLGCGAEDVIDNNINGFLIPQNDPQLLAEKLSLLLSDPVFSQEMGLQGQAKARMNTWSSVAQQIIQLYESYLRIN